MENADSRRGFLKKSAVLALGAIAASTFDNNVFAVSESTKKEYLSADGTFTLPALPYAYDALEPFIDKLTMEIHYSKHHKAYVDNLNKALATLENSQLGNAPTLNTIFIHINTFPIAIRNNAGGHYNHSLFWTLMKPNGGGEPKGKLADAIKTSFGSFEEFKKQFTDSAMKRFGSGWAWLIESNGKLSITSTPNQDNPLMSLDSIEHKGKPLLALDVWEHAYYLKHQNLRVDYINDWWKIVNWDTAETLYIS
jgi:Fe-Mn family superoxide dismutase